MFKRSGLSLFESTSKTDFKSSLLYIFPSTYTPNWSWFVYVIGWVELEFLFFEKFFTPIYPYNSYKVSHLETWRFHYLFLVFQFRNLFIRLLSWCHFYCWVKPCVVKVKSCFEMIEQISISFNVQWFSD